MNRQFVCVKYENIVDLLLTFAYSSKTPHPRRIPARCPIDGAPNMVLTFMAETTVEKPDKPNWIDPSPDFGAQLQAGLDWPSVSTSQVRDVNDLLKTNLSISDSTTAKPRWDPPAQGEFATNSNGKPLDPVNFYFHGSEDELRAALKTAGWTEGSPTSSDKRSKVAWGVVGMAHAAFEPFDKIGLRNPLQQDADKFPLSNLYYQAEPDGPRKPQIAGFSRDTTAAYETRHHLRIFDTGKVDTEGRPVLAISASYDDGFTRPVYDVRNIWDGKHTKEYNTDRERDFVLKTLRDSGFKGSVASLLLPFTPAPDSSRSEDGRVYEISAGGGPSIVRPTTSADPANTQHNA